MPITIALAGNPNCGKTTMFNDLTGSSQYVGNWPGVTVEKKEGTLRGHRDVTIQDLPGIYSLSPYTLEEVVARDFLVKERPDAVINIVDGTNIERNLYLTTQLLELGLPVVVAVNMIDLVRKNGDRIDLDKLSKELGCAVLETSALRGEGSLAAAEEAIKAAEAKKTGSRPNIFTDGVEEAVSQIEAVIAPLVVSSIIAVPGALRWYAVKIFERDERAIEELSLTRELKDRMEEIVRECEARLDDDAESIITNQRYTYITGITGKCVKRGAPKHSLTPSDRIDRIVTHRVLALPIFAVVMFLVYAIAMGGWSVSIGTAATDWANDGLFGDGWFIAGGDGYEEAVEAFQEGAAEEPDPSDYGRWVDGVPVVVSRFLESVDCAEWLTSLIVDGIIGGVGAVLGFVPQMLVLFLLLSTLEDVGYIARVAFIMDRVFRKFGLSGKSFIPMLIGTGCGVPGVMASRTIENQRDRRMTVMTTCFMPCGAKMPIIALFAGALFGGSALVAASAYFVGIASIVISGIILKKTRAFAGDPAPFVMELPAYHVPALSNVLHAAWERGWSFIKRAGTIILASSIVLWFLQGFGFADGSFGMVEENSASLLAALGSGIAFVFAPLGFGSWQATVAAITGLIAKEEVVSTLGVLYPGNLSARIALAYTPLSAYSFMLFNLLCAPCFAAMGAIGREMNNRRWTAAAIGYMCGFAYCVSLAVYQLGGLVTGEAAFGPGTIAAIAVVCCALWLLARKAPGADCARGGLDHLRTGGVKGGAV